jgi:hypothetical protein
MGEMNVEHVLLFLVGAFLVYHMMGKCRRVEGATTKNNDCKFFGDAPLCSGECPSGWKEVSNSMGGGVNPGDGGKCLLGKKLFCCPDYSKCEEKKFSWHDMSKDETRINVCESLNNYKGTLNCEYKANNPRNIFDLSGKCVNKIE